ncbi:MAG: HD domain-containing protein [Dehalococcoidales bacterium]|nr:HD domain-containing protein [Dehalococcoidales bacterium]
MEKNKVIIRTESYVRELITGRKGSHMIAHDFNHVNRVRNWAMIIANGENFSNLQAVEITALLHDVGLSQMNDGDERKNHGPLGAGIAGAFLRGISGLNEADIILITDAIYYHGLAPLVVADHLKVIGKKGKLLEIIRDADNLDGMGAVGLIRAFASRYFLPEYDPSDIKGSGWGLSSSEFHKKFGYDAKKGLAPVNNIIDQVNQQIRHYENLHTLTARKLGQDLVEYMKSFVIQLENEIEHKITPLETL